MRLSAAIVSLGLGSAAVLLAQAPSDPPPVFRSSTAVIPLQVSVLDHHRHPVRGLTAADFIVRVDGKPVPVSTFSEVVLPGAAPMPAVARDSSSDLTVSRPVSPAADEGRLIVIVFDRSIAPGPPM